MDVLIIPTWRWKCVWTTGHVTCVNFPFRHTGDRNFVFQSLNYYAKHCIWSSSRWSRVRRLALLPRVSLPYTAGISYWDRWSQGKNIEETLTGCLNLVAPLFSLTICRTGKRCFFNVVFLGSVIPGPNLHCVIGFSNIATHHYVFLLVLNTSVPVHFLLPFHWQSPFRSRLPL